MTNATTLQLGFWQQSTDQFVAHPNSPTGAILNLNDGVTYTLMDKSGGKGEGFDWGTLKREVLSTGNPRTVGEVITVANYRENRELKLHLYLGPAAAFVTLDTALHNLVQLCRGITKEYPGALQFQYVGMATPIYFDVLEAHVDDHYQELMWWQGVDDTIEVTFTVKPFARGARQWLQNLVNNPGAETPSGPGVSVFTDTLTNTNAYQATAYLNAVETDTPLRLYTLGDNAGQTTVVDLGSQLQNGTVTGGVTLGQSGDQLNYTAALLNGTTGYITMPSPGTLPTGNAAWSLEALVNIASNPSSTATVVGIGTSTSSKSVGQILITSSGVPQADVNGSTVSGTALSTATWHHLVATYDGTTLKLYVDGSSVGTPTTPGTLSLTGAYATIGVRPAASTGAFLPGTVQMVAVYNAALTSTRVTAHYTPLSYSYSTQDKLTYLDVVLADAPVRYYRMDEASGTTLHDAMGSGNNATTHASPTLGATGLLTGDSDTAVTFASASSQYASMPTTGLPSGAMTGGATLECLIKYVSQPASGDNVMVHFGTPGSAGEDFNIAIDGTTKKPWVSIWGTNSLGSGALSNATTYHVVGTYDGAQMRLYVNGSLVAGPTTVSANIVLATASIAYGDTASTYTSATMDEVAIYNYALSSARVTAHYTAATNAPSTTTNTLSLPAGAQVTFGSPAWTGINQWQVRFRWTASLTANFYIHYLNPSNYLLVQAQSSSLNLINVVAGASTTIATNGSVFYVPGMQYWVQITQFPFLPQVQAGPYALGVTSGSYVQATLLADSAGAPGNSILTIGPAASTDTGSAYTGSGVTSSLVGRCQIGAVGAALGLGGNFSNINQVQLFGPGGWGYSNISAPTGPSSGAWETYASAYNAGNTYGGGPVVSYGAGRIDCAPAGTVNAQWLSGTAGSSTAMILTGIAATQNLPVGSQAIGQVFGVSAWVKAPLIGASATVTLSVIEYNSSGAVTTSGSVATHTGPLSSYTQLSGTYTVANSSTTYLLVAITLADSNAGASANATLWWDNVLAWNQTVTGATTMPWCDLRGTLAPGTLVLSGLLGDTPAPAMLSLGVNIGTTAWPTGRNANIFVGRRAKFSKYAFLVANYAYSINASLLTPTLSSTNYGGWYLSSAASSTSQILTFPSMAFDTMGHNILDGQYHAFGRIQVTGAATASAVGANASIIYSGALSAAPYSYPNQYPFSANSTWYQADLGLYSTNVSLPSTLANQSNYIQPFIGCDTSSKTFIANVMALIPVDAEFFALYLANPSLAYTGGWVHSYLDGINRSATFTVDTAAGANPANAIASVFSNASVTSLGYSQPIVDPTLAGGINQFGLVAQDSTGNILPYTVEVIYSPLYDFSS
jgi:hypothetical protein